MQDLSGKITGDQLPAVEWNQLPQEIQNIITQSGQTLTAASLTQLRLALARFYSAPGHWGGAGVANAYTAAPLFSQQAPDSIQGGYKISFRPVAANTSTTPTLNAAGQGSRVIVMEDGSALAPGDLSPDTDAHVRFDSVGNRWLLSFSSLSKQFTTPLVPDNYISGFSTEGFATGDIDFGAGIARMPGLSTDVVRSSTKITKDSQTAWAAGNNQGGLGSGIVAASIPAGTWMHMFILGKPMQTNAEFGIDTDVSGTNILNAAGSAGWTMARRVGSYRTIGAGAPEAFKMIGGFHRFRNSVLTTPATLSQLTSPTQIPVLTPPGVRSKWTGTVNLTLVGGFNSSLLIEDGRVGPSFLAATSTKFTARIESPGSGPTIQGGYNEFWTDDGQVWAHTNAGGSSSVLLNNYGYFDIRGQDEGI